MDLGFDNKKLLTIYNGIDLSIFLRDHLPPDRKVDIFGLPEDSVILTTVAVIREQKGIQYMLNVLPEMMGKLPNLYYVIVGDGNYLESLENLSETLGIAGHVVFMHHRTNIPEILAASDLFVFPTLSDALPTVLLEAMAAGVPIVASEVGGVPEILENDVNGLLVPPADPASLADACLRLLCDKSLADRLTAAAHDTVLERFDIRQYAGNLLKLYEQVLTEHEH